MTSQGIKVLSLFFIDRVANYRSYDAQGNPQKGKYALWFEEAYKEISKKRKYKTLFGDVDTMTEVEKIHDGYFAQDKKGHIKDSTGKDNQRYFLANFINSLCVSNLFGMLLWVHICSAKILEVVGASTNPLAPKPE